MIFFTNIFYNFFFHIYTYALKLYQLNVIMKIKKDCKKNLVKDIKIFLKKKKKKQQEYGCERYKNLSENEIQKFVEYRKKYQRMRKNSSL